MQTRNRIRRWDLHQVIAGGVFVLLLESGKEEGLVFANRTAGGEAEDIIAEDGLLESIQLVEIGNRIESL